MATLVWQNELVAKWPMARGVALTQIEGNMSVAAENNEA